MAGTSVDLLFFPIDTLKTRLQSAQGFVKAGGFKGIYKGIGSVLVGSAPGGACMLELTHPLYLLTLLKQPPHSSQRMTRSKRTRLCHLNTRQ